MPPKKKEVKQATKVVSLEKEAMSPLYQLHVRNPSLIAPHKCQGSHW